MRLRFSAAVFGTFALLAFPGLFAAPVAAYEVLLDHNTDGIRETFQNVVVGEVTVPIDIVVAVGPGDLGATFVQAYIEWGYGGGGLGCFDVYGSIDYEPYLPLPDSGPFVNIIAFTCVCKGRCACEALMVIEADVTEFPAPGLYLLARLDFSRIGFAVDCSHPIWPVATFAASAASEGTLVIQAEDVVTGVEEPVESRPWGQVKALYRQ